MHLCACVYLCVLLLSYQMTVSLTLLLTLVLPQPLPESDVDAVAQGTTSIEMFGTAVTLALQFLRSFY